MLKPRVRLLWPIGNNGPSGLASRMLAKLLAQAAGGFARPSERHDARHRCIESAYDPNECFARLVRKLDKELVTHDLQDSTWCNRFTPHVMIECFGCGSSGNVLDFWKAYREKPLREAAVELDNT